MVDTVSPFSRPGPHQQGSSYLSMIGVAMCRGIGQLADSSG
jgi:hypothetical protein